MHGQASFHHLQDRLQYFREKAILPSFLGFTETLRIAHIPGYLVPGATQLPERSLGSAGLSNVSLSIDVLNSNTSGLK